MNNDKEMTVLNWILAMVLLATAIAAFFTLFVENAAAAPIEEDGRISSSIFDAEHTRLPDDSNAYYRIDVSGTTEEKENNSAAENFVEGVTNFNPIKNTAESTMMETVNMFTNMALEWNMMMVNLMIGVLNFGFETDIINAWIDMMDGLVQNMAGISGVSVTGGVFGSLLGFASIIAGIVAIYQILVHKAILGGMQTMAKTVLVLTAAFILFANFGPMMKGMNAISTDISATLLTGTANVASSESRSPEEVRGEVGSNLWGNFIGRPYMILQYGTDNVDTIGEDRVNALLAMKPGADRQQYVDEIEIGERGNDTMTYASSLERFAFTIIYSGINALVSLPVFALALAMIIFQLWFLMMAFYAPFALIQAAFPGQFGSLKRYAIELVYPLVCKILVTVATLFIFTIGFAIYSIPPLPDRVGIAQYFVAAILQFGMFGVFFIFRKRIGRIIGAGSVGPFDSLRQDITGLKQTINTTAGSVTNTAVHVAAAAATGGTSTLATVTTAAAVAAAHKDQPAEDQTEQQQPSPQPITTMQPEEAAAAAPAATETTAAASQPLETLQKEEAAEPAAQAGETYTVEAGEPITEEAPAAAHQEPEAVDYSQPLASLEDMETPIHKLNIKDDERSKGDGADVPKAESQD